MNINYTNVVKKIILQKPADRNLFFNKRKNRLQYIFESCEFTSREIPTIHVVGTKGKGSTSTFLANILKEANYTTGLFTSPHLHKIPERIKVNLEDISENLFTNAFDTFVTKINEEKLATLGGNSFFETLMILALIHFKNNNVTFQIFEAGIGGTHDSTNFIPNKIATLITNISLDHQNILGNTLEEIANDKAGAISENSVTISAPQEKNVNKIISEINTSKQSVLKKFNSDIKIIKRKTSGTSQSFVLETNNETYNLTSYMLGPHQVENAGLAILAAEEIIKKGYKISKENIENGIKNTSWPGRLQVIKKNQTKYYVDGAHNSYSIKQLIKSLKELDSGIKYKTIFGATSGHSYKKMLDEISKVSDTLLLVKSRHPKAVSIKDFKNKTKTTDAKIIEFASVEKAIKYTKNKNDTFLVTGSLSVAAEALESLNNITPELYPYL
ncbi:MAG: hypothetical protein CL708_04175 [Chloroflexi bacterium]|nr:hypothetical protein [Chloroflexota bacterium]